jgi:hypothetical protein
MKTKIVLPFLAFIALGISFTSCKKTNDSTETSAQEISATTELSGNQAITDNLTEDANNLFMGAASDKGVLGARPTSPCGTISITATGFPKTIDIDFGTGCTNNGVTRSGKITIVLSNAVRKPGSTAVMTFTNYIVNGFKLEGTHTWTNTSTQGDTTLSWQRKVENGKVTNTLNGKYWTFSGIRNVVQISGNATPLNLYDDVFSVTGTHTVTNMYGKTRTTTIITPLIKATSCAFISKGSLKLQGPNHYAIIDYGDGTCDDNATYSIDGGTPVPFIL